MTTLLTTGTLHHTLTHLTYLNLGRFTRQGLLRGGGAGWDALVLDGPGSDDWTGTGSGGLDVGLTATRTRGRDIASGAE